MESTNHSHNRQRFVGVSDLELLTLIQSTRREDALDEFGIRIRPVVTKILYRDYCAILKGVSKESMVAEVIADLLLDPPKQRQGEPLQFTRVYLTMRIQRTMSAWKNVHQRFGNQPTVSLETPVLDDNSDGTLTVGETLCAPKCDQPEDVLVCRQDEDEADRTCNRIRHTIDTIGNEKHREAVRRRLLQEQEYSQISDELKVTQAYARKIYQLGLSAVRAGLPP